MQTRQASRAWAGQAVRRILQLKMATVGLRLRQTSPVLGGWA